MALTQGRVEQLRRNAGRLKKGATERNFTHGEALNLVALAEGFNSWRELEASALPAADALKIEQSTAGSDQGMDSKPSEFWPWGFDDEAWRLGFSGLAQVVDVVIKMHGRPPSTSEEVNALKLLTMVNYHCSDLVDDALLVHACPHAVGTQVAERSASEKLHRVPTTKLEDGGLTGAADQ
ncbi:hypothetical protein [Roseateles sp. L2-2]|uniref:hypothetical protein n=1 Tax=Roseateles sp. L2-2 TaxID=3422597 RepID=UPI003D3622EB